MGGHRSPELLRTGISSWPKWKCRELSSQLNVFFLKIFFLFLLFSIHICNHPNRVPCFQPLLPSHPSCSSLMFIFKTLGGSYFHPVQELQWLVSAFRLTASTTAPPQFPSFIFIILLCKFHAPAEWIYFLTLWEMHHMLSYLHSFSILFFCLEYYFLPSSLYFWKRTHLSLECLLLSDPADMPGCDLAHPCIPATVVCITCEGPALNHPVGQFCAKCHLVSELAKSQRIRATLCLPAWLNHASKGGCKYLWIQGKKEVW